MFRTFYVMVEYTQFEYFSRMKKLYLVILLVAVGACQVELGDPPYPFPRSLDDHERLLLSTPMDQIPNYFDDDPLQHIEVRVEKDASIVGVQEWMTYDLLQPGLKTDWTLVLVVENDSLREMSRKPKRWYDDILAKGDFMQERLEKKTSTWQSQGMSVEVIEL